MKPYSKRKLSVLFRPDQMAQIEAFLDRAGGFSLAGEMAIVQMFADMQEYAPCEQILQACEYEWANNWGSQDLSERGSPGAEGAIGVRNTVSIEIFYFSLGLNLSSALAAVEQEIPVECFSVTTRSGIYHFGKADLEGWRTVTGELEGFKWGRGKVCYIAPGKPMKIEYLNGKLYMWDTTPVFSVQEANPQ